MTDANLAVQRFVICLLFQVAELSGGTEDSNFVMAQDCHSG
jgi:hypothetical protein